MLSTKFNVSLADNNKAYAVLVKSGDIITTAFTQEPKVLAMSLFASQLITERVLQETNELNEINEDKGRRLYTSVLEKIRAYPEAYSNLVSILETNTIYSDLLGTLRCV